MSGIPRKEYKTAICPYCGKERTYEYRDAYTEIDYSRGWPDKQIPAWDTALSGPRTETWPVTGRSFVRLGMGQFDKRIVPDNQIP